MQGAAKVSGERGPRINHQRAAAVVRANLKRNPIVAAQHKRSRNGLGPGRSCLINVRSLESQFTAVNDQDEVAIGSDLRVLFPLEIKPDLGRIGAGRNFKVVFEAAFPTEKIQTDAGVKAT